MTMTTLQLITFAAFVIILNGVSAVTTTPLSLPSEPRNLSVVSCTGGAVVLTWLPPLDLGGGDITTYDVSFFAVLEPNVQLQQQVTGISPTATNVTAKVVNLLANSTYGFSVSAVNDVSACLNSSALGYTVVYATTATSVTLPDAPRDLAVVSGTSGLQNIQWSSSEDTGGGQLVNYLLFSESNGVLYNGTNTKFTRGLLKWNTVYNYSVSAWNDAGTSNQSMIVSARTSGAPAPPAKPRQFTQSNSTGGSIGLSWQMPLDTGGVQLTGYKIYRNGSLMANTTVNGDFGTYLDDQGLLAEQDYVYVVEAINSIGRSVPGQTFVARTGQATSPIAPCGLLVASNGGNLTAAWTMAGDTGGIPMTFFRVQLLQGTEAAFIVNTTNASYVFYGIRANRSYTIVVATNNKVGESSLTTKSVTNGAAVLPAAPPVPENVTFLSWKMAIKLYLPIDDGGSNITQLLVYQDNVKVLTTPIDTSSQATLGDLTTRSVQNELGPLRGGTTYNFTVSAVALGAFGEGSRSKALYVTTDPIKPPSVPTNLVVTDCRAYSIFLAWVGSYDTGGDDIVYDIGYINNNATSTGETIVSNMSTVVQIMSLRPGKNYSFRVRAQNSAGSSAWTDYISSTTLVTDRGVVIFQVATPVIFENISTVAVQLVRVNGSSSTITCSFSLATGNAIEGRDFILPAPAGRAITFGDEELLHEFVVQILNNDVYDPVPRIINLTLTDASSQVPPTFTTITVLDDGDAGRIGFVNNDVNVSENARVLNLDLQRLGGSSSATSIRILAFNGYVSTSQIDIGYRIPSSPIDFPDGKVTGVASIIIKDNDVYDFPYLLFFLTLEISAGGSQVGTNSVIRVVVQDDGDRSAPGPMNAPVIDKATGGMLALRWDPPVNVGGQSLWVTNYIVSFRSTTVAKSLVTPTNSTTWFLGSLDALTNYSVSVAAINTVGRGDYSPNATFTTTNYSTPGPPAQITLINRTGGLLTLNVSTPVDMGGAPVTGYIVYLITTDGTKVAYNGTGKPSAVVFVSVAKASTAYRFQAEAINFVGIGDVSEPFTCVSGPLSRPGPPRLPPVYFSRTGGALTIALDPPIDTGGHEELSYMIYYREQDSGARYQEAYFYAQDLKITVFRLAAQSTYEMIAVSFLPGDKIEVAWGTIYSSNSSIVLLDSETSNPIMSAYFDFGGYLFEVDTSRAISALGISYLPSWSTDEGALAAMNLVTGDEYEVYTRGAVSAMVSYSTDAPSRPGLPPEPTLWKSTGGALHVRLSSPNDTGGISISGFELFIDNKTVNGVFYAYTAVGDFNLQATVEIGGLSPQTSYEFYYIPTNDASACPGSDEERPKSVKFVTGVSSVPEPIQVIRDAGSTGGGIRVLWEAPNDRGSDGSLYYQVYMSQSRLTPVWALVYNDTKTSFWQTKLQKVTPYLFMASCMNDVGYSSNSSVKTLTTSLVSVPGPPSGLLLLNTTGGQIHFSWDSPEDDGGSSISYYIVRGVDSSGEVDLTNMVRSKEIAFGGLLASRVYKFEVFAGNSMGAGSDAGEAVFSTTAPTLPSSPSDVFIQECSGGAVTLAIRVPQDTGGVAIKDLTCIVYANGVQIPPESIRRRQSMSMAEAPGVSSRRLSSILTNRQLAIEDEAFIYIQAGGLLPSVTYSFTAQAVSAAGMSDSTTSVEGTTSIATVPAAPDSPKTTSITGGALVLSWSDPVDTGGVPLVSYRLSAKRLGGEVGICEGLIWACTVGSLLPETEYTVTLVAYNPVGASPPSQPVTFTTFPISRPKAPQRPLVVGVSNIAVFVAWDAAIDFGGADVQTYQARAVRVSDNTITYSASVPIEQLSATISGLTPTTEYVVNVVPVTANGIRGDSSNNIYVTTTRLPNQPRPPAIGCFSRTTVIIYWEPQQDARCYFLYRNGIMLYSGTDVTTKDEQIALGTTNSYYIVVEKLDGTLTSHSDEIQFVPTAPVSNGFDCAGDKGYINMQNYTNSASETWTITPQRPNTGVVINMTSFWLECDHDSLAIEVTTNNVAKELWKGGCHRTGSFVVSTDKSIDSVDIKFISDASVTYAGFALHYEVVQGTATMESASVPCPLTPTGLCAFNGACRRGSCSCFSGFVGESCSNVIICPDDMTTCSSSTCDPICFLPQNNVLAVAKYGNDAQGTGELMDTSPSGTDSKAVQTLRRALNMATQGQTILLFPGFYSGVDYCGLLVTTSDITIRGLKGSAATSIDCKSILQGFNVEGVTVQLTGFTLVNTATSTNGGAIHTDRVTIRMEDIRITNSSAQQSGGAIYASRSDLVLTNAELIGSTAGAMGGAVFLADSSSLTIDYSTIKFSSAREGGGIYAQNGATIIGDSTSKILQNHASLNGGGICISGACSANYLNVMHNSALIGAGVAITGGSAQFTNVTVVGNSADSDGGGIALIGNANLILTNSPISTNQAARNGGGVFMKASGILTVDAVSKISNCSAVSGGGVYLGEGSQATVHGLAVHNSTATVSGGCAAFLGCSATLKNTLLESCVAHIGGGLYASSGSNVVMPNAVIAGNIAESGAGMYVSSSSVDGDSDAPLSIVRHNLATSAAGGVFLTGTASSFRQFTVTNCTAKTGGGIVAENVALGMLHSVIIQHNNASSYGGGIFIKSSTIEGMAVEVAENRATTSGGGIYATDSGLSGAILVARNTAKQGGGATSTGTTTLQGLVLDSNAAALQGGGLSVDAGSLVLENITILSCLTDQGFGGGISLVNALVRQHELSIQNCSAVRGGGIYANGSVFSRYLSRESTDGAASLIGTQAEEYGGGFFIVGNGTIVSDVTIANSSARLGGGLAALQAGGCSVVNVDISHSTASLAGAGALFGTGTNCTFRDSRVTNNQATHSGGGVKVHDAVLYHSNLDIVNNEASTGGGMHIYSDVLPSKVVWLEGNSTVKSRIASNVIYPQGGNGANVLVDCAVDCALSGTEISNGILQTGEGGGMFIAGHGNTSFFQSLIVNNTATKGGGIAIGGAQLTTLDNVAIVGNIAGDRGGGLWAESLEFYPEVSITSCVFYNNSARNYGGAISLLAMHLSSLELLVVDNYVLNTVSGSGGGLHLEQGTSVMADVWLFLLNGAALGGSIAGTTASEISILDAIFTHDSETFFIESWRTLFIDLVGFDYVQGMILNHVGTKALRGGHIYLSDRSTVLELLSSFVTHGSANIGGAAYVDLNAFLYAEDTEISYNSADEQGGGFSVSTTSQVYLVSVKVLQSRSKINGGGLFVETSSTVYTESSDISDNYADDSGGAIYVDTGDQNSVILNLTSVDRNLVQGQGCGVFIGREAVLSGFNSQFVGNGGMTSAGKNENGGAIYTVDGVVKLNSCTLENNTAVAGGAVFLDRSGAVTVKTSHFIGNTADQLGGAIATDVTSHLTVTELTYFEGNKATSGGALSVDGQSIATLTSAVFSHNQAKESGGALYSTDQATVSLTENVFENNSANAGGAVYLNDDSAIDILSSQFLSNAASTRGGALYYKSILNANLTEIVCTSNNAQSGGCLFWISDDNDLTPVYPCKSCTMTSNAVYDIATNTRDVDVMWWPANVSSGIIVLEQPDEESIELIMPRNESLETTTFVWPRLKAVDLYGQIEVLDSNTECTVSSGQSDDQMNLMVFYPRSPVRAIAGVMSYHDATFFAEPQTANYSSNVSCVIPDLSTRSFVQNVKMLPCPPGFSVKQKECERCPKNTFSLDGLRCFDCPAGAKCNMTVRRATETVAQELGTVSPRTEEGFYLFSAPASKQQSSCLQPSLWKDEDPCKAIALADPTADISDVIYDCSDAVDFNVYWPAERLFSCLSGKSLYTCDVAGACQADVTVEALALSATISNFSCANGYDLTICSVCAQGFKRASDNSCLPCNKANAEVRASIRWQNFVIPVLLIIGLVVALYSVRIYLRDLTEIGLLEKAEADRRLKPPASKTGERKLARRASTMYRRRSMVVMGRWDQFKYRVKAFFKRERRTNKKILFGVDVSPPMRTFPVNPSKFKIILGFFQIFGNFQSSFTVKWSTGVQNIMGVSQKFNLDFVAIAGIDCVITKNFYFDFTATVGLIALVVSVITAYFYAGMRSYRRKLQLIPRNCLRCGLPVLESATIRNDDESFNPFLLLKSWWRTYNFNKRATRADQLGTGKAEYANTTSVVSVVKETRALKRKFGMSQVRTPYLGLFRSVHTKCPIKRHVLSGEMLDRTIRSNLRVWQARVKLRMNYLTYRNKCLKLYCWVALFLYPTVSKTILTVYNCQEVGDVYYLVADRRLVCYNGVWAVFGVVATVGVVVWVVGIPFFFGLLIWLAQDRGVAPRLRLLRKPQLRVQRQKWLKEVEEQQLADGRYVRDMDSIEVQDEELAVHMKRKNLADSTVQARLGFIYAEYADSFWWFEVVDLSRKLFLSGVIIFVGNGSVEQVLLAAGVCLVTMWFLLYFQPYDGHSDNLIACIAQLQLFFTLWLGIMIQLNDLNSDSLINTQLLGYLLVGTCIVVTGFGLSMIIGEGLAESRRLFIEAKAEQTKKVRDEVWKRWNKAYNYAVYEAQMLRFGGDLKFADLSEPAILEASRRAKLAHRGEEVVSAMPRIDEGDGENSLTEVFLEVDSRNGVAKKNSKAAPRTGVRLPEST